MEQTKETAVGDSFLGSMAPLKETQDAVDRAAPGRWSWPRADFNQTSSNHRSPGSALKIDTDLLPDSVVPYTTAHTSPLVTSTVSPRLAFDDGRNDRPALKIQASETAESSPVISPITPPPVIGFESRPSLLSPRRSGVSDHYSAHTSPRNIAESFFVKRSLSAQRSRSPILSDSDQGSVLSDYSALHTDEISRDSDHGGFVPGSLLSQMISHRKMQRNSASLSIMTTEERDEHQRRRTSAHDPLIHSPHVSEALALPQAEGEDVPSSDAQASEDSKQADCRCETNTVSSGLVAPRSNRRLSSLLIQENPEVVQRQLRRGKSYDFSSGLPRPDLSDNITNTALLSDGTDCSRHSTPRKDQSRDVCTISCDEADLAGRRRTAEGNFVETKEDDHPRHPSLVGQQTDKGSRLTRPDSELSSILTSSDGATTSSIRPSGVPRKASRLTFAVAETSPKKETPSARTAATEPLAGQNGPQHLRNADASKPGPPPHFSSATTSAVTSDVEAKKQGRGFRLNEVVSRLEMEHLSQRRSRRTSRRLRAPSKDIMANYDEQDDRLSNLLSPSPVLEEDTGYIEDDEGDSDEASISSRFTGATLDVSSRGNGLAQKVSVATNELAEEDHEDDDDDDDDGDDQGDEDDDDDDGAEDEEEDEAIDSEEGDLAEDDSEGDHAEEFDEDGAANLHEREIRQSPGLQKRYDSAQVSFNRKDVAHGLDHPASDIPCDGQSRAQHTVPKLQGKDLRTISSPRPQVKALPADMISQAEPGTDTSGHFEAASGRACQKLPEVIVSSRCTKGHKHHVIDATDFMAPDRISPRTLEVSKARKRAISTQRIDTAVGKEKSATYWSARSGHRSPPPSKHQNGLLHHGEADRQQPQRSPSLEEQNPSVSSDSSVVTARGHDCQTNRAVNGFTGPKADRLRPRSPVRAGEHVSAGESIRKLPTSRPRRNSVQSSAIKIGSRAAGDYQVWGDLANERAAKKKAKSSLHLKHKEISIADLRAPRDGTQGDDLWTLSI